MTQLLEEILEGVTVFRVLGNLTFTGLSEVEASFDAIAGRRELRAVIDIGQVEALTTPAITLMLRTARAVERNGGKIVYANPRPAIARMFACCRLDAVLELASGLPEAIRISQTIETSHRFGPTGAGRLRC